MNNEVLEKIEGYNNGGLCNCNEPITFSNSAGTATLLKLLSASSISPRVEFFSKDKIVELSAAHIVDAWLVRDDPMTTENYIRDELARKLAKQLIEEDLIQIQSCEDINSMTTTFRAQVKVIQE